MSSLAYMALREGRRVGGSDRSLSPTVKALGEAGCQTVIGHFEDSVDGYDLVVYTAAVSEDSPELKRARELKIPTLSRAEYLGGVMLGYKRRIGVSGTHGKTTVTTLLSHIALTSGLDPTVMNGAQSRTLSGEAYRIGSRDIMIYEACEYKASFHDFHPTTAVINNIELDHTDFYPDLETMIEAFRLSLKGAAICVVNGDDPAALAATDAFTGKLIRFSLQDPAADYFASEISASGNESRFLLTVRGKPFGEVTLPLLGSFNIANVLAAIAASHENGIALSDAVGALVSFQPPDRRFQVLYRGEILLADDYAHHPSEIRATLIGARALVGKTGRLITVFQSHTYTRTHDLFDDFVKALSLSDLIYMPDIFAAREKNTLGVSSEGLCRAIGEKARYVESFDEIAKELFRIMRKGDVILTMGAGDVYKIGLKLKSML